MERSTEENNIRSIPGPWEGGGKKVLKMSFAPIGEKINEDGNEMWAR